jgi:hypothetical protein
VFCRGIRLKGSHIWISDFLLLRSTHKKIRRSQLHTLLKEKQGIRRVTLCFSRLLYSFPHANSILKTILGNFNALLFAQLLTSKSWDHDGTRQGSISQNDQAKK